MHYTATQCTPGCSTPMSQVDFNEFFLWFSGSAKARSRNASPDFRRARGGSGAAAQATPIGGRKELDERLLKETDRRHVH